MSEQGLISTTFSSLLIGNMKIALSKIYLISVKDTFMDYSRTEWPKSDLSNGNTYIVILEPAFSRLWGSKLT